MLVLFSDWLKQRGWDASRHWVLTVDHGLRPGSSAEAHKVSGVAQALGLRHAILTWEGPKPASGIQAAARAARYRLMHAHMHANGIEMLLTAHTQDDQAETVLMRLARGSGVDGLSGIASRSAVEPTGDQPLVIARPFLSIPKARLVATLRARGVSWIEDPTNLAVEHERVRLRALKNERYALGLTDEALALSARRLGRARRTLDLLADRFCRSLDIDPCGVFHIDRPSLLSAGEDVGLRVIARAIAAAGGSGEPVPLAGLEAIAAEVLSDDSPVDGRWTLARAMITAAADSLTIEREPPRQPLPALTLSAGARAVWDGRFVVAVQLTTGKGGAVQVGPLGEVSLSDLSRQGAVAPAFCARAASLVPAFRQGDAILAVPSLGFWKAGEDSLRLTASFVGISNFSPHERPRDAATRPKGVVS
jgi:tRNA(Ile)-lysidine synthase